MTNPMMSGYTGNSQTESNPQESLIIHVGADPREWPEFSALREEINKMNHPARPEMNWRLVESLSLSLFRANGVDLQTACYYTLARTSLARLHGFTEGCEILAGLIVNQWENLWPEQPHARSEILEWFNGRVSAVLRQLEFTPNDLPLLYRAVRALELLNDRLHQVNLKKVPRIENLLYFMQNQVAALEKAAEAVRIQGAKASRLPPMVFIPSVRNSNPESAPTLTPPTARVTIPASLLPPQPRPGFFSRKDVWLGLTTGIVLSLLLGGLYFWLSVYPTQQRLASLESERLSSPVTWQRYPQLESYSEQMALLAKASPLAPLETGDRMVAIAQQRWPNDEAQRETSRQWQQLMQARSGGPLMQENYTLARQQTAQLAGHLLTAERARGSLTLSFMKSAVYNIQQQLDGATPIEELLRQLAWHRAQGNPPPPALTRQIDERIETLLGRYYQMRDKE